MKSIYFYDGSGYQKSMAFGQMIELMWACYTKGNELGYDDIYVEWHQPITIRWFNDGNAVYGMNCPRKSVYPLKFVEKGIRINADECRDISKPDSLWNGCQPLISPYGIKSQPFIDYLNMYAEKYGKSIKLELNDEKSPDEKYILFHYRYSQQDRQKNRNIDIGYYEKIVDYLIEKFPAYKLYKIGEISDIDRKFDRVFGYFLRNTDRLFELINNCSYYVGPLSGPVGIAIAMQKPLIALLSERDVVAKEKMEKWYSDKMKLIDFKGDYLMSMDMHMRKYE